MTVTELELAEPGPGEVLVRLHASGVCHSDQNAIDGTSATRCPAVLGHEGAGVVEAIGPGVARVVPGDHVALSWAPSCGQCAECLRELPQLCSTAWPAMGTGGLLDGSTSSTALNALLEADASSYTWVAAAVGSNSAAGYQLATQQPVMAIGGFNGSDPSPTLAQFKEYVAAGKIHYFIAGGGVGGGFGGGFGGGGIGAGGSTSSAIAQWVESTFTARTVDGVTVYDLTTGG
jgi:hypothetical protein